MIKLNCSCIFYEWLVINDKWWVVGWNCGFCLMLCFLKDLLHLNLIMRKKRNFNTRHQTPITHF
jgi:hypothetical protein